MSDGQGGCFEWIEPARAEGVHAVMVRLLGRCTCQAQIARVVELYTVDGARTAEPISA